MFTNKVSFSFLISILVVYSNWLTLFNLSPSNPQKYSVLLHIVWGCLLRNLILKTWIDLTFYILMYMEFQYYVMKPGAVLLSFSGQRTQIKSVAYINFFLQFHILSPTISTPAVMYPSLSRIMLSIVSPCSACCTQTTWQLLMILPLCPQVPTSSRSNSSSTCRTWCRCTATCGWTAWTPWTWTRRCWRRTTMVGPTGTRTGTFVQLAVERILSRLRSTTTRSSSAVSFQTLFARIVLTERNKKEIWKLILRSGIPNSSQSLSCLLRVDWTRWWIP